MAYGVILGQTPSVQSDFPIGGIIIWSGSSSNIPKNWHLCDGTSGTPNLRDRFILGAGATYNVGDTGGEATHTLTVEEMPSHNHTGSTASAGAHTHEWRRGDQQSSSSNANYVMTATMSTSSSVDIPSAGAHTHTLSISNTGGGQSFNILPPYYALCYIMKIS